VSRHRDDCVNSHLLAGSVIKQRSSHASKCTPQLISIPSASKHSKQALRGRTHLDRLVFWLQIFDVLLEAQQEAQPVV
jgi:hypothetical protein